MAKLQSSMQNPDAHIHLKSQRRCSILEQQVSDLTKRAKFYNSEVSKLDEAYKRRPALLEHLDGGMASIAFEKLRMEHLDGGTSTSDDFDGQDYHYPLLHFGNTSRGENKVALVGPCAATWRTNKHHTAVLTSKLQELKTMAAEADELLGRLMPPKVPRLQFRAMVAVDLEAEPPEAEILVRTQQTALGSRVSAQQEEMGAEWLPSEVFIRRLDWLKKEGPIDASTYGGDVWAAAANATSDLGLGSTLPIAVAQSSAAAAANLRAEADRLRRELLAVKNENAQLHNRMGSRTDERGDLRIEIEELELQLAQANNNREEQQRRERDLYQALATSKEQSARLRIELDMEKDTRVAQSEGTALKLKQLELTHSDSLDLKRELVRAQAEVRTCEARLAAEHVEALDSGGRLATELKEAREAQQSATETRAMALRVAAARYKSRHTCNEMLQRFDSAIMAINVAKTELAKFPETPP